MRDDSHRGVAGVATQKADRELSHLRGPEPVAARRKSESGRGDIDGRPDEEAGRGERLRLALSLRLLHADTAALVGAALVCNVRRLRSASTPQKARPSQPPRSIPAVSS